jgi:hypothetical protein
MTRFILSNDKFHIILDNTTTREIPDIEKMDELLVTAKFYANSKINQHLDHGVTGITAADAENL